jgi:precorrin-2/cobalt-factor-2 C20-methyltransferase
LGAAWQTAAIQIAAALPPDEPAEAVYLLLGDPLLYGTFAYIRQELAARRPDIAVEIIPGVTSFATAAAHAHMTLAAGAERVAILPADTADLRRLLADFDTVILMKAGPVLPQVLATLAELNLLETTLYAEYVGLEEERLLLGPALLANFGPGQQGPYLSLLIVKRGNALCP